MLYILVTLAFKEMGHFDTSCIFNVFVNILTMVHGFKLLLKNEIVFYLVK